MGDPFKAGTTSTIKTQYDVWEHKDIKVKTVTKTTNGGTLSKGITLWTVREDIDYYNDGTVDEVKITKYAVDQKGNVVESCYEKFWDENLEDLGDKIISIYKYDKQGRLAKERSYRCPEGEGDNIDTTDYYVYDDNGNKIVYHVSNYLLEKNEVLVAKNKAPHEGQKFIVPSNWITNLLYKLHSSFFDVGNEPKP